MAIALLTPTSVTQGAGKAIGGFAANTGKVILEVGSGSVMAAASLGLSLKGVRPTPLSCTKP